MTMIIKANFTVRKGKFKPIRVDGFIEDFESCSTCGNGPEGDLEGDKCYYLSDNKLNLHLQICEDCFEELNTTQSIVKLPSVNKKEE